MSPWISVKDQLPEDGQTVAFVVKNSFHDYLEGRVLGGKYIAGVAGGFSVPGMTNNAYYWMPLPDAPKELG